MPKPQLLKAAIMSQQIHQLVLCSVLDSAEHIAKILYRIQVVLVDVGKVKHQASKAHTSFWTANKITIIAIFRYSSNLALTYIVREVKTTILQATQHTRIFSKGTVHSLEKFRLILLLKVL